MTEEQQRRPIAHADQQRVHAGFYGVRFFTRLCDSLPMLCSVSGYLESSSKAFRIPLSCSRLSSFHLPSYRLLFV